MVLLRVFPVFGFMFCVSYAEEFRRFRRFPVHDNHACSHEVFITSGTSLLSCALLCARRAECKRMFHTESNICKLCSTLEVQPTNGSQSISYVLNFIGCYVDPSLMAMTSNYIISYTLTIEDCRNNCALYKYFGVQHHFHCMCGNSYDRYGKAGEDECNSHCSGNANQICGGAWRNSVYYV